MRKWIVLIAMAGLMGAACTKEEAAPVQTPEEAVSAPGTYLFTLNATMEEGEATKTAYAGDKTFSWSAGDQISVLFHNGDDNKFFTLTTTGTGASASFSGEVTVGYTIGASDGEHIKWALFPANANHTYTAGEANPISFYVPPVTDFTSLGHFSANIPMQAQGDGDNSFSFKHIAGCYKFTFTNMDVSKVKFVVEHVGSTTYRMSGPMPVYDAGGGEYYLRNEGGSGTKVISFIRNVDEGTATFYVPFRSWAGFKPKITLINMDEGANYGYTLLETTAKVDKLTDANLSRLTVIPSLAVSGTGRMFYPGIGINWNSVTNVSEKSEGIVLKGTADQNYLYLLMEVDKDNLLTDPEKAKANKLGLYLGNEASTSTDWKWSSTLNEHNGYTYHSESFYLTNGGAPSFYNANTTLIKEAYSADLGTKYAYEMKLSRSEGDYSFLSSAAEHTAHVACVIFNNYAEGASDYSSYLVAPTRGVASMFEVALPGPALSPVSLELHFTEATGEVTNPERGMMSYSKFVFTGGTIPSVTNIPVNYTGESLAFMLFYMTDYMNKDLDDAALNFIRAEFDKVRAAKMKAVVRFAYDEEHEANQQHEATPTQLLKHVDQVADILTDNADILYLVQGGWLGTYGEWYYKTNNNGESVSGYTDYYLYTVDGSTVSDLNNNHKNLLDKALTVVPSPIQIGLRTPTYKRYYLSPGDIAHWDAISSWGTGAVDRLAFYNDGFRGSTSDVGTFNSDNDRNMWYSQGNRLICGGEMSYKSQSAFDALSDDLKDCDQSIAELKRQHFSYLHYSTSNQFMAKWISEGRLEDLKQALGYRLVLGDVGFDYESLASGETVSYSIKIKNTGCAPVVYPRPFKLMLLHNVGDPTVLVDNLGDIRDIAPDGSFSTLSGSFDLPVAVSAGDKLAIWMPDNAAGLQATPAFSIRLANTEVTWDSGYNVIHTF